MSNLRKSILLLVLLVRAALAGLLGFFGALWLCRTRDVENIIQKLSKTQKRWNNSGKQFESFLETANLSKKGRVSVIPLLLLDSS